MYYAGPSFLIPQAYDPSWTRLDDGNFNDYPAGVQGVPSLLDAATSPSPGGLIPDAVFYQTVPIPGNTPASAAVLPANLRRVSLLIQNNSTPGTGGVAPNLYVAYDGPVSPSLPNGLNLTIAPGAGILFDRRPPANAIYILYANGTAPFTAQGVIQQGMLPTSQ